MTAKPRSPQKSSGASHANDGESAQLRDNYAVLSEVTQACAQFNSAEELFPAICEIVLKFDSVVFAWIGYHVDGTIVKGPFRGIDDGYLNEIDVSAMIGNELASGPIGQAVLTGNSFVNNDFLGSPMTRPWHQAAIRVGFQAAMSVPLHLNEEIVAVLSLYSKQLGGISENIVNVMNSVRSIVSLALKHYEIQVQNRSLRELVSLRDRALGMISHSMIITEPANGAHLITYASPSFFQLTGYRPEEVLGRDCRFLQGPETNPETVAQMRRALQQGLWLQVEILNYKKDGEAFWNDLILSPVFDQESRLTKYVGVQSDVSERRHLESQLLRTQKLEAIGTLAGGIAHDFNNLLLVMQGYASILMKSLTDENLRQATMRIQEAVEQGAHFTRQLLAYSRQQMNRPRVININTPVSEELTLLESLFNPSITLTTDLSDSIGAVFIDASQVQQIVMNLVNNSIDALANGGSIIVRTEQMQFDDTNAAQHDLTPGPYVMLEVSDTGIGMDAGTLSRIFDPFYSTKNLGTGLGLASVYGIVKQSGGHISAYSEPDVGTTFNIYFPEIIFDFDASPGAPRGAGAGSQTPKASTGDETVLIVEDHDQVRALLVRAMREYGYHVLEAENGRAALELAEGFTDTIHVLLTDVIMPEINGRDLAELLYATRPELKVVYTSGYPSNLLHDQEPLREHVVFVEKPYQATTIASVVRHLLDGNTPNA